MTTPSPPALSPADVDRIEKEQRAERPVDPGGPIVRGIRAFVVVFLVAGMSALYWPLFFMGTYGYGDVVYLKLASYESFFWALFLFSSGVLCFLVLFDVGYWRGTMWYVGRALVGVMVAGYALLALVCTQYFPAADIIVYLCLAPLVLYVVKITALAEQTNITFVFWCSLSLLAVAAVSSLAWVGWVVRGNNYWEPNLMLDFFIRLNCTTYAAYVASGLTLHDYAMKIEYSGDCNAGFLYWLSPIILSIWSLFMCLLLFLVYRAQIAYYENRKRFDPLVQGFAVFLALCLLGMWVAAGIAGAEISLATDVFAFSMLGMVLGVGALIAVSGVDNFANDVKSVPIIQRLLSSITSDWLKSLLFFIFAPLLVVVVPLAFIRQMGRRYLPFTKTLTDEKEKRLVVTLETARLLHAMSRWNWSSILMKATIWGLAFDVIHVGISVLLNIFFSYLNDAFAASGLSFASICVIFTAVCVFLILLPPTPGMPLFLAAGVIIVQAGMTAYGASWFWSAWGVSTFLSVVIKLAGVFGGQLTGQLWGDRSVALRRLVNVNSMELRAIKFILLKRGLSIPKVAILLGGPDWPVAAIAGILRTSYIGNLIGTLPIIFMIIPLTLSTAFLLRASEGGLWATAASCVLSVGIVIQGASMIIAMHYIDRVIEEHRDELLAYPTDEAVAELEEKSKDNLERRKYASQWKFLPFWLRAMLIGSYVLVAASAWSFGLFQSKSFVSFAMRDHIKDLPGGVVAGAVKPMGWVFISFACFGLLTYFVFGRWISWVGVKRFKPSPGPSATSSASAAKTAGDVVPASQDEENDVERAGRVYGGRWAQACCMP